MGLRQTKLSKSSVSKTENKCWWKNRNIHKTKEKPVEVDNRVSEECEETTEQFIGEACCGYTKIIIKATCIICGKPIQGKSDHVFQTSVTFENSKEKAIYAQPESELKLSEEEKDDRPIITLHKRTPFEERYSRRIADEQTAKKSLFDNALDGSSNCLGTSAQPVRLSVFDTKQCSTESLIDSTDSQLSSSKTDITERKGSINSLLDAESKADSCLGNSHTEIKAINDHRFLQNAEIQLMNDLNIDFKGNVDQKWCNRNYNLKPLKCFETSDSGNEEESDSFTTSVKSISSSYPDSDLYSDNSNQIFAQTSDGLVSVSTRGHNRNRTDSWSLFRHGDKHNVLIQEQQQQTCQLLGYLDQNNDNQIINGETVKPEGNHENSKSVLECQSVCEETVDDTEKIECEDDNEVPNIALKCAGSMHQPGSIKCQTVPAGPGTQIDNDQMQVKKSFQIEKEMPKSLIRLCKNALNTGISHATYIVRVNSANLDTSNVANINQFHSISDKEIQSNCAESKNLLLVYALNYDTCINNIKFSINPDVNYLHIDIIKEKERRAVKCVKAVTVHNSNSILTTANYFLYPSNDNVRCDHRRFYGCSSRNYDAQIGTVKVVWKEMSKLICLLYFLEYIKRIASITVITENGTYIFLNVREGKQFTDKDYEIIYANAVELIHGKDISVLKSFSETELRYSSFTISDSKSFEQGAEKSSVIAYNVGENQNARLTEISEKCKSTYSCIEMILNLKQATNVAENTPVVESPKTNNNEDGKDIDSCQDDNSTVGKEIVLGQVVRIFDSKGIYPKLEGLENVCDGPEISNTRHDFRLSESVVKGSLKEMYEQSTWEEMDKSLTVNHSQLTDSEISNYYITSSPYTQPAIKKGLTACSIDEMSVGSTRRIYAMTTKKEKTLKGKKNDNFMANCTSEHHLLSNDKSVISSDKPSADGKLCSRKKHRIKKRRKKSRNAKDSHMKHSVGVNGKHSQTKRSKEKIMLSTFCYKYQRHIRKHNSHCRHCQKARGEFESILFHNHVSKHDSGIASMISSTRSLILSQMERMQSLTSVGKKENRKHVLNELFSLGLLNLQLNRLTKGFNLDALANAPHSIIAFPGLRSYFDSLRDGITPSLQERMTYEWLRLMSFSSYNGGGSSVHLARGGFYHHQGNETRCFCCNVSYSNWTYTDDVQAIHRRISPDCPFVVQGVESNRNTPVGNSSTGNQSQPPSTQQSVLTPSVSSTETPGSNSSVTHGGFSFGSGMPVMSQTRTHELPRHSFYPNTSANLSEFHFTEGADPAAEGADISSQVTSQLSPLTIQQSAGAQQPTEEPISGNPLIVPTQPSQIARQTDGDAQLIVSAQQPPEANDTQQNTTGNQGTSGASSSRPPPSGTESADILPIGTLKHPRYGNLNVRMSSFASWPSHLNQTPRQMAYAGFFHPGVADFARCFCCGGGLRNWEADDDPMVEHARWYPRCEYINKLKGTHFVQAVLRRHREHMAERQREQERSNDNAFTSPDPMTTEVAANLLEMGFTQERAREAILTVRRLRGRSEVTAEEVTTWMLDDENTPQSEPTRAVDTAGTRDTVRSEERSEQRNASASSSSSGSNSEPTVTTQGATSGNTESSAETQGSAGGGDRQVESKTASNDKTEVDSSADETAGSGKADSSTSSKSKSKKGKKSKSRKGHSPSGEGATSSQGDIDTKSLKEENKLLKQMQVCKICMDKYVSVTFLPCGHLVCCEECARSMRKCPICRKRIKGQVKTFMS